MKSEYDLDKMKRRGHPLRKKVSKGEIKLIKPTDIPNTENKIAKLTPDEREIAIKMLESSSEAIII